MRITRRGAFGTLAIAALLMVFCHIPLAAALPVSDVQPLIATSSLPLGSSDSTAAIYNNYIYQVGGSNSQYGSSLEVNYAHINSDGSVATWVATTPLPNAVYDSAAAVYNGYIYVVGGAANGGNGSSSTVYYAPLNNDGTVGSWNTTTSLPQQLVGHSAVVNGGYIYAVAGTDTTAGFSNKIYYAPLNNDGTVGSWVVGATLPDYSFEGVAAVYNDHIYVTGGLGNGFNQVTSVYIASLNIDGSISSGQISGNALPAGVVEGSAVANNGYMYILGGGDNFNVEGDAIYYAQINNDGTVGVWQTSSTRLPTPIKQGSAVVNNGYVYSVGGYNNGSLADVYYSAFTTSATADTDGDGVLDTEENEAPNYGDANGDSIPDAEQANVTSLLNPVSDTYQVITTDCDSLFAVQVGSESSERPDNGYRYPMGLTAFRARCSAPGVTANFSQTFFDTAGNSSYVFRKWSSDGSYATMPGYLLEGVPIAGQIAFRVSYSVKDGGDFDEDGTENGVIVDPAGLGLAVVNNGTDSKQNGGTLAATGQPAILSQLVIAALLISSTTGLVVIRRRELQAWNR